MVSYELYQLNGIAAAPYVAPPPANSCDLTVDTELAQLEAALHATGRPEADLAEVLEGYRTLRCAMREPIRQRKDWEARLKKYEENRPDYSDWPGPAPDDPPVFDLTPYETLLTRLPEEFSLYARGAAAYRGRAHEQALPFFEEIESLPPVNRSYVDLAASYMLGMTCLHLKQYDRALAAYDRVEKMVKDGVPDPAGLASTVAGWKGRVHYEREEWAAAAKYYLKVCGSGNREEQTAALLSLRWTFSKIDAKKHAEQLEVILADEDVRKALLAWCLVNPFDGREISRWLIPRLELLPGPLPYAERIAWLAYNENDMKGAKRWADLAEPGSVLASWVRAKVFLHDGDMDAAIKALSQVVEKTKADSREKDSKAPVWQVYAQTNGDGNIGPVPLDLAERAQAELSAYWVVKKPKNPEEWILAFENLSWHDRMHLAERVMKTEELCKYVRLHFPPNKEANTLDFQNTQQLREVLGRRLVREGRIEEAAEFFRDPARESGLRLVEALREGRNASNSPRERAARLLEAARLTREEVPYETFLYPDWDYGAGFSAYLYSCRTGSDIDKDAVVTGPDRRFNERFIAADLMWEAAALLPDNDPLTAEALYEGGFPIKYDDPKAADRFYKALVRRNPNLAIAQEAKRLHWFPREFNDRVLYTPLPHRFFTRKRAEMIVAVAAALAAFGIAETILAKRKRRKRISPE